MQRKTPQPGTPEAIVLEAIYEAAQCRVAAPVSWSDVRAGLVEQGALTAQEANEARTELEVAGYVLSGSDAAALCNDVRVGPMDVCVTEHGKAAIDDLEMALPRDP